MPSDFTIETARDERTLLDYARVISRAFTWPQDMARAWALSTEPETVRVARAPTGDVLAGLYLIPMGQFFAAQSVSLEGVAAVVVEPDARGMGLAHALLMHALRDMHARGVAISGLFPASWHVYRKSGYELAGVRAEARLDLRRIEPPRAHPARGSAPSLRVRRADIDPRAPIGPDFAALRAVYARTALLTAGRLDRSTYIWSQKILSYRGDDSEVFLCENAEGHPLGYIALARLRPSLGEPPTMHIRDMEAATPDAARALLSFLAGHRSSITEAHWLTGPTHPILLAMPERIAGMRILDHWMIRPVDLAAAFAQRGYPRHARADLVLDLCADPIDENNRAWRITIGEGRGACEPIENAEAHALPRVRAHIRALGPLYSGYQTATALAAAGLIEADPDALDALDAAFAGSTPWIGEMY